MLEQPNSDLMQQFGVRSIFQPTQVNKNRLTQLTQCIDENNIKIHIDKTFSLDETAKALDYVKDVHSRGNVILNVRQISSVKALIILCIISMNWVVFSFKYISNQRHP